MDRSRFSTHKRPAFLPAGVLLVLLGIWGAWHVLSRQAQSCQCRLPFDYLSSAA